MQIVKVKDRDKKQYMELLLIADEQVSMIEKYLYRGDMFALLDDDLKSLCVVTREGDGVFEIKNIVTVPEYQRKGYGQRLISFATDYCARSGSELYVGTGESPMTLGFYEKCGFKRSHVVKGFFTDNYDHPMYENGKRLTDMIYLLKRLPPGVD